MRLPRPSVPRVSIGDVIATAVAGPALLAGKLVSDPPSVTGAIAAPVRAARTLGRPLQVLTEVAVHPARAAEVVVRHHERRIVTAGRRLHVELHPLDPGEPDRDAVDARIAATVEQLDGVRWARVREPFRRLVVQLEDRADADAMAVTVRLALDELEEVRGLAHVHYADRDHPADDAPIVRDVLGIGADVIGITLGSALQTLRFRPPPIEVDLAAALNVADQAVPVRRTIERRLGAPLTDVSIGFANSIVQGVVQGPLGPMVDLGRRVLVLRELDGRRAAWLDREAELFAEPDAPSRVVDRPERATPVPDGPIERYEKVALAAAATGGAVSFLASRRLEQAASVVQATLPKAARLGREGYVRELSRHLADRRVVVLDPPALTVLDRVDCIAIGADLLVPGGVDLAGLVAAAQRGKVRVLVELGDDAHVPTGAEAVRVGRLDQAVRDAQAEGHVVALATAGPCAATLVADLSLGMVLPDREVPWGAHLLGTDDPADVILLLEAILQARKVSSESVKLAAVGAGSATILAVGGFVPGRFQRGAPSLVSLASALSLVNGLRHAYDVERRPLPVRLDPTPWHALDVDAVLDRLGTGRRGLSSRAAAARLVVPPTSPPLPVAFVRAVGDELVNPLTPVLAGGAALSVMVGSFVDALLVGGVVVTNALVGGVQNLQSQRALQALSRTQPSTVSVLRDGRRRDLLHDELVQGDVVRLFAGQSVPADCRIVEASSLEVDESALTGESVPVTKSAAPVEAAVLAERSSMLYEGSWIAAGDATAVIVATGDQTEARRAVLIAGEPPASGVEARLRSWTSRMIPIALLGGGAVIASGVARARPLRETLGAGVSLAVAAVPEGLPLLSTVAQTSAARRLSRRNVLVRNARAIEALGRVDVLCADKTGTLTEGRITLKLVTDGVHEAASGELDDRLREVLAIGVRATPVVDHAADLTHPTDRAVAAGADVNGANREWDHHDELAFEPGRGFHAAAGRLGDRRLLAVKGAPEAVLPRCTRWRRGGRTRTLTPALRSQLEEHVLDLARRGLRVLAVAEGVPNGSAIDDDGVADLTFVGLLGLADPPRATARTALELLDRAGVRVLMITGDHPSTAEAIAADLGLLDHHQVVTGEQIDATPDDELGALIGDASVFARVTPAHKVRIVRALQRGGHTVAMTGDGANDAPAIRLADVGIALGSDATPAARMAADIVVLDERIETIVDAIIEGRGLWGSVRDAVAVLVGGNLGEIAFTVLGSLATGRSPLNARQLLLVNLLTDAAPALAIAARPPRGVSADQLLSEGPDTSLASALDRAIAVRAAATTAATATAWLLTGPWVTPTRASTTALVTTVGAQLGQTIMTSSRDPIVLVAGVGSAAVLLGVVQTPGLSQLFGCTPLDPLALAIAGGSASTASVAAQVLPRVMRGDGTRD